MADHPEEDNAIMASSGDSVVSVSAPPSPHPSFRVSSNREPLPPDWQTTHLKLAQRGQYMLTTGTWSDCQFVVGLPPNEKVFKCHRIFLAMASPVFEAMFYGGLAEKDNLIKILDVQPEAFSVMLQYIYTDDINLNSFELVCEICYAAKKYMLPALVEECTKYLWRDLYPRNACRAYEFAKLFEEPSLMDKSLQIIRAQTKDVLEEPTFDDIEHSTLCVVLSQDTLSAQETLLFDAMHRWSEKECERRNMDVSVEAKRECLGDAMFLIRYLTFSAADFAAGPAQSGLLSQQESFAILMNISSPGSWELPDYMNGETEHRKLPWEIMIPMCDPADTPRQYCKRQIVQEPHLLNTSILDCSVTFTVDKDICVHGIEVPSQVTTVEAPHAADIPIVHAGANEYNELLYAHLLDAEGSRLTYTHFTAKVKSNSIIEITFNRSIYIKAGKVYKIGMVLNKVGWYPSGVQIMRRIQCDNCLFTFCVGQPNDSLRDGLIRSIIYTK